MNRAMAARPRFTRGEASPISRITSLAALDRALSRVDMARDQQGRAEQPHGAFTEQPGEGLIHLLAAEGVGSGDHAQGAEGENAQGGDPAGMDKAAPGGAAIGEKAAIHHHRVMHRVTPHLQQGHQQQYGAGILNGKGLELQQRRGEVPSANGEKHQQAEGAQEHQHLEKVGAQAGVQTAEHGVDQGHQGDGQNGQGVGQGAVAPNRMPTTSRLANTSLIRRTPITRL